MKRIKKIIYAVFALTMVVGLFSANTQANDSLPANTGSLTIHKYLMDDLGLAGAAGVGNELTAAELPTSAVPVEGVAFDVYKIDTTASVPMGGSVKYTIDSAKTTLTVTDGATVTTYPITSVGQKKTDASGVAKWDSLAKGYYFAVENLADSTPKQGGNDIKIASAVAPFVVSVPMTNPTGNGWITDVHAYPKNQPLTIEKTVNKPTITVGEGVRYTIKPTVPYDIKTTKSYVITDVLDEALTFDDSSVQVRKLNADGSVNTSAAGLIPASNYVVAESTVGTSNKVTWTFTDAGRVALDGESKIAIIFDAKVNEKILNKPTNVVENKATVELTNEFDQKSENESIPVKVNTGTIQINKTANDTSSALAGAKFKIAKTAADAQNGNYIRKAADGTLMGPADTGYAAGTDYEVTTDANGVAKFEGLKIHGTENPVVYRSYWLV